MSTPKNKIYLYSWIDNFLRWFFRRVPQQKFFQKIALWWGFKYRGLPTTVKLRTGQLMYVDPTDYLQSLIYYFGMFEPHCITLLQQLLKDGDTFIDIGGNIGLFSVIASSKVGPSGKVITFEPAPFHCEAIRKNLQLNNFSNVDLYETALGDSTGNVKLALPKGGNQGSYSISFHPNDETDLPTTSVPVSRLDDVVKNHSINLQNLSLVKMDIEGAEMLALAGMTELFKISPSVLIEFNESALSKFGTNTHELFNWFESRSYLGWIIQDSGQLVPLTGARLVFAECLFIHSKNKQHLAIINV